MIKNKLTIRKILKSKAENDNRLFEVEWENTWENEEYIREVAPKLLDEYLAKESNVIIYKNKSIDIITSGSDEINETIDGLTNNESIPKPRRIGGIHAVISRLNKSLCIEPVPGLKINYEEECRNQVNKKFDNKKLQESTNQFQDSERCKMNQPKSPSEGNKATGGMLPSQNARHDKTSRYSVINTQYSSSVTPNDNLKYSLSSSRSSLHENALGWSTSSQNVNRLLIENSGLSVENSGLPVENSGLSIGNPGVLFKCSICSEILYEDVKYRQHMYMHEQVSLLKQDPPRLLKPGTFECKFCNLIFDGKDKLKTHYTEKHEKEFANTQPSDQLHHCSNCEMNFMDLSTLTKHLEVHRVYPCQLREKSMMNDDRDVQKFENDIKIKEEVVTDDSDQQSCNSKSIYMPSENNEIENIKFLKSSPSMTTLNFQPVNEALMMKKVDCNGMMTLDDKKLFRCNLCDEMFETESDRAQHSLIHVDRSNSLDCHVCGKQFRHRTNLTTHLIVHSGIKPHQCTVCLRRFTQKVNLQRHMHIHEGSRPFGCTMCSKSFTQKANLQRHILSHTEQYKDDLIQALTDIPNESDASYSVDESVDAISENKTSLDMPSSNETMLTTEASSTNENVFSAERQEFRCDICEKTFAQKANLHKHLLIHSGSKPFQCYVCGKAFRQRSSLQKHYTIHTNGSSSFMCQTCNRMFGSRTNLQRHMLVHVTSNTECYICNQKCTTTDNLERHFSEHIEEASLAMSLPQKVFEQIIPGEAYHCVKCEINFDNPMIFNQHLQCHQRGFPAEEPHVKPHLHDGASPLQCEECGVIFMSSTKLTEHIEMQHTVNKTFEPNGKLIISTSSKSNKTLDLGKPLVPKFQEVNSSSPLDFVAINDHRLENCKEKKPTRVSRCPICKELFASKVNMKEHYASVHNGENNESYQNVSSKYQSFAISPEHYEIRERPSHNLKVFPDQEVEVDEKEEDDVALITEDEEQMIKDNEEFIKDNILGGSHEYESKGRYERGNYSCKICNRTLTYKYSLEKHMLIHTGIYPYKCHLCSKRFNHKPNLDKHLIVHSGEKPHVCHLCHRAFSQRSNLQRHQLTHTQNRDFVCEVCGKRFNHMASLKTHSLIHTGAKPFSCYICTKRFNQKGNLKRHVQTHKTGKRNRLSTELKNEENSIDYSTHDENLTYYNDESSQSDDEVKPHYRGLKMENYDLNDEEPPPTMLDGDLNRSDSVISESEQLKTSALDESFRDSDDILTVVPSDELSEYNKQSQKLKTKKETFHCDSCSKLFVSMASLETHKRTHHSLIVCDVCGKQFSQKANLLKHKLIHMNKKPFPCQTCNKAFRQKANLQRHEMIHNKERKSVNCEVCQKSFRCLWSLKQHMKNHSETMSFVCTVCGESFDDKVQLSNHHVIHSGITVYSCRICSQNYQSKDNLLAHVTTHENVPLDIQQQIEDDEGHELLRQEDIPVDIEESFVVKMNS